MCLLPDFTYQIMRKVIFPTPVDKFIISQTMRGNSKIFFIILEILPVKNTETKKSGNSKGENTNLMNSRKSIAIVVGKDGEVLDDSTRNLMDDTGVDIAQASNIYARNQTKKLH
jgi:hypothetical protein